MPTRIQSIVDRIHKLQDELEQALLEQQQKFEFTVEKRRIKFQSDAIKWQKQFKRMLFSYIFSARLIVVITAPVIYSLIIPIILLDLWASLYQMICFPVYKMPKVPRREFIMFDRQKLGYLNLVEKLNCAYCSYGNGVLAYVSEIAAKTESYWCPIKHAQKMRSYHRWYGDFAAYGDAENYQADLERNMKAAQKPDDKTGEL